MVLKLCMALYQCVNLHLILLKFLELCSGQSVTEGRTKQQQYLYTQSFTKIVISCIAIPNRINNAILLEVLIFLVGKFKQACKVQMCYM